MISREAVQERARRGRGPFLVAVIVIALLFSGMALRDLNGLLQGMRASDEAPHTIGSLAEVTKSPGAAVDQAKQVLGDWHRHGEETLTSLPREPVDAVPVDALYVARLQILIDAFVFALAYTGAFWLFFRSYTRRQSPSGTSLAKELGPNVKSVARIGQVAVLVTLGADELENRAEWAVVHRGWDQLGDGAVPEMLNFAGWGHVLWAAALLKWLALLFVVTPAAVGLALVRFRRWREGENAKKLDPKTETEGELIRRALWRLRVHLLIVVALGALLLGHEQMPDVIRAWSIEQLGWSLFLALVLTFAFWITGRWLLALGSDSGQTTILTRLKTSSRVGISLAAACFVLALIDWLTVYDIGWGWAILGIGILLVVISTAVFRKGAPPPDPIKSVPQNSLADSLPEALTAAVPILLGLAVFHASFAYAVYLNLWAVKALGLLVGAVALGLLVGVVVDSAATNQSTEEDPRWWAEPVFWAFLGGAAALAIIGASADMDELNPSVLAALGVLLGLLGWGLHHALSRQRRTAAEAISAGHRLAVAAWGTVAFAGAVCIALIAAVIIEPWLTAAHLGGIAVLVGFLLMLALAGSVLVSFVDGVPASPGLRVFGFHRTPIFAFLLVWFLVASALDKGGYHDVRRLTHARPAPAMTLAEAWSCWLEKNELDGGLSGQRCRTPRAGSISSQSAAVPILFVSTSGGGIRAAYWTASVLDCALEVGVDDSTPDEPCAQEQNRTADWRRSNAVFAMSGISGGGLGLATYAAFLSEKQGSTNSGWIRERMDADSLSASIAWWLVVELPRAFLRYSNATDRAEILERGWERDWGANTVGKDALGRGLLSLQRDHPELPFLLLNGTSVADGCRFNNSILNVNIRAPFASPDRAERCRSTEPFDGVGRVAPDPDHVAAVDSSSLSATRDFVDFRCDDAVDIPLSSAALLAARFPFVSPAGRVEQDCTGKVSYVVDGGYLETSGASPIIEVLDQLLPRIVANNEDSSRRCIIPLFIQIDNGDAGYRNLSSRPGELNVPLKTLFASRSGRAANARNHAALLFSERLSGSSIRLPGAAESRALRDRYAHFNTYAHPGPNPPLGWTLSERSRVDLRTQLGQPQNVQAMKEVRSWFAAAQTGGLTCER